MSQFTTVHQHQLHELAPGSSGGRKLASERGQTYFHEIGSRGGKTTLSRHGMVHLRQIASAGGRERCRRLYTMAATIRPWYGGVERRVPFWPPRSTKRRHRPMFVYIELEGVE